MLERLDGVKSREMRADAARRVRTLLFVPNTSALDPSYSVMHVATASGLVFDASNVISAVPFG